MADSEVRQKFEAWVTAMEPAYASENLERLTGGRGSYRVHNVACWWMAWQEAYSAGMRAGEIARWIPVEEKLPELGVSVLVLTTPNRYVHDVKLVKFNTSQEWRSYFDHNRPETYYWLELSAVTHWQPLPAAPEEKKP